MAKQEGKESMLVGQGLGKSAHFFLPSEVGGCYYLWMASQGKLNAQKAPGLPWLVFLDEQELGFCGSQGADRVPSAHEEVLGLTSAPAAVLPKPWTRP